MNSCLEFGIVSQCEIFEKWELFEKSCERDLNNFTANQMTLQNEVSHTVEAL